MTNSNVIFAVGFAAILGACKPKQDNATLASSLSQSQFAIVKGCSGDLGSRWQTTNRKNPVKGELSISVETAPNTKKIKEFSLRQLIPERRDAGTNEVLPRSVFEIKNMSVASLTVTRSRGGNVTFVKAAPNQTAQLTTGGSTTTFDVVSLDLRNNNGADQVKLKLSLFNKSTGQPFTTDFTFEGCNPENLSLLIENSKE